MGATAVSAAALALVRATNAADTMALVAFAAVASSTIIAAVGATSSDGGSAASAFQQRGLCLAAGAAKPRERTPLVLSACSTPATLDAWLVGTDPLGHPQVASAVEPGLCINDDSVKCTVSRERTPLFPCMKNVSRSVTKPGSGQA